MRLAPRRRELLGARARPWSASIRQMPTQCAHCSELPESAWAAPRSMAQNRTWAGQRARTTPGWVASIAIRVGQVSFKSSSAAGDSPNAIRAASGALSASRHAVNSAPCVKATHPPGRATPLAAERPVLDPVRLRTGSGAGHRISRSIRQAELEQRERAGRHPLAHGGVGALDFAPDILRPGEEWVLSRVRAQPEFQVLEVQVRQVAPHRAREYPALGRNARGQPWTSLGVVFMGGSPNMVCTDHIYL